MQITTTSETGLNLFGALERHITIWGKLTTAQQMAFFVEAADAIEETGVYEISKTYTWNNVPVTVSATDLTAIAA